MTLTGGGAVVIVGRATVLALRTLWAWLAAPVMSSSTRVLAATEGRLEWTEVRAG
jgi:hypothetical protein